MKNHLKPFLLLLAVTLFLSIQLQAVEKNKSLLGEWVYEVSDAPYGYEKGSLIFSEKDGQTICTIKLEAGELEVSNLKFGKDSVTFTTYVDGSPINVKLARADDKLTGNVDSSEGPKAITAIKKED